MYIKNCRNSSNIKHCSPIEHCSKLENECFEIGNFSYTKRYVQLKLAGLCRMTKKKCEKLKQFV